MIKKNRGYIHRTKMNVGSRSLFFNELKRIEIEEDKKGILYMIHSLGGGTEHYQNMHIEEMRESYRIYVFQLAGDHVILKDLNGKESRIHGLIDMCNPSSFKMLLDMLKIDLIYVNNLVTYPVPPFLDSIQNSGVEYRFFIHDYFCVCPKIQLLNQDQEYCGAQTNGQICQDCLNTSGFRISIKTWRNRFEHFLVNAAEVIAPSQPAADVVKKYYPQVKIEVREHLLPNYVSSTFRPEFAEKEELNIAFIGNLNPIKGSEICLQLHEKVIERHLPLRIIVIGTLNGNKGQGALSPSLMVTGPFANRNISHLLEKYQVAFVISPSVWPETYCYSASEALLSGYPLVTFDLGAPAERVRRMKGGWVLDEVGADPLFRLLARLSENREEILEKAGHIKNYKTGSPNR